MSIKRHLRQGFTGLEILLIIVLLFICCCGCCSPTVVLRGQNQTDEVLY